MSSLCSLIIFYNLRMTIIIIYIFKYIHEDFPLTLNNTLVFCTYILLTIQQTNLPNDLKNKDRHQSTSLKQTTEDQYSIIASQITGLVTPPLFSILIENFPVSASRPINNG